MGGRVLRLRLRLRRVQYRFDRQVDLPLPPTAPDEEKAQMGVLLTQPDEVNALLVSWLRRNFG